MFATNYCPDIRLDISYNSGFSITASRVLLLSQDYLTDGFKKPVADAQQDFNLMAHEESDGKTTLMFTRKRNTSDSAGDVEIKVSEYSLILTESPAHTKATTKLEISFPEILGA